MTTGRRILLSLLAIGLTGAVIGASTWSAFFSTTSSSSNKLTAGTVTIGDNDLGGALLSLTNAKPGDSSTRCILVTYSGSLNAYVRMYAAVTGSLGDYVDLTVTRGTDSSPSFSSCAGTFTPDPTDYIGAGAGVVYSGLLSSFPTSATAANEPTAASPATWNSSAGAHSYRFTATLRADAPAAAQGASANATFTWEAKNK
ncbi:MAG TPA: TasA family protein [Thermoleophilaceae bacterium]|jgi:hypothetical protein